MALTFSPEGPFPLIAISSANSNFHDNNSIAQWFSTELSLMHNVIIRGLNSIWLNAPLVSPSDTKDFVGYGLACMSLIRAHHQSQENVAFPRLQQKLDMRKNVVQHLAFESQLRDLESYLHNVYENSAPYDYEKILELRAALGAILVQHLHDEISTVSPKLLQAFSIEELNSIAQVVGDHKKDLWDSATLFPFIVTHHHKEDAPDWPVVPTSVKWFANHVGFHLHSHYWKFSPYSFAGDFQVYPPRGV